jgi:hypothetical protein
MKPKLYLETTIPSYLLSRPNRDLIIAGHQQITREWWDARRTAFDMYVSQFVIDEVSAGDTQAAGERIKLIRGLPRLGITHKVNALANGLLAIGVIPKRAAIDAAHIAIAAAHAMDFLMTWNCTHLANATIAKSVASVCGQHGCECPVICTPEELMGA